MQQTKGKRKGIKIHVQGPGVMSVDPRDVLRSSRGRKQIEALGNLSQKIKRRNNVA